VEQWNEPVIYNWAVLALARSIFDVMVDGYDHGSHRAELIAVTTLGVFKRTLYDAQRSPVRRSDDYSAYYLYQATRDRSKRTVPKAGLRYRPGAYAKDVVGGT
jgi:hypothetical protein